MGFAGEALDEVRSIGHAQVRARSLGEIGSFLADTQDRSQVVGEALNLAGTVDDTNSRTGLLAAFVPHLEGLPYSMLYTVWSDLLPVLASATAKNW